MLDSVEYASLLQYSTKGTSKASVKSRELRDVVKAGRLDALVYPDQPHDYASVIVQRIKQAPELSKFLNPEVMLVPAPRSSPLPEGHVWPTLLLAQMLASNGFGYVEPCLERVTAVPKSAFVPKGQPRPTIQLHYESMRTKNAIPATNITLVDDILTLGRTSFAAASRLAERFPTSTLRIFCLIRTIGLDGEPEIEELRKVRISTIKYNTATEKCLIHEP